MIGTITGTLEQKNKDNIVVETSMGLGFIVCVPIDIIEKNTIGTNIKLQIESVFKQDGLFFYGFNNKKDKLIFQNLISVQGVGAKVALCILSSIKADMIINAIYMDDDNVFKSVSGIGPKTAKRICNELKDKINKNSDLNFDDTKTSTMPTRKDLFSALINLGYNESDISNIMPHINDDSFDVMLKQALKKMTGS